MFDFFNKNLRTILTATLIAFIGGIFIGFGGYLWGGIGFDAVATVNKKNISFRRFQQLYLQQIENLRARGEELNEERLKNIKTDVLHDLIREEIFFQEANKYNILVTDKELAFNIQSTPAFRKDDKFDPSLYYFVLRRLRMTPRNFEEFTRRRIAGIKLRNFIIASTILSKNELEKETKYMKSENPKKELLNIKSNAVLTSYFISLQNNTTVKIFEKRLDELTF